MALIECTECGRQISSNASACPGCGNPAAAATNETASSNLSNYSYAPRITPSTESYTNHANSPALGRRKGLVFIIISVVCLIWATLLLLETLFGPTFLMSPTIAALRIVFSALLLWLGAWLWKKGRRLRGSGLEGKSASEGSTRS